MNQTIDDLEAEIEIFRRDEETAQQFLFAYLGVRETSPPSGPTCWRPFERPVQNRLSTEHFIICRVRNQVASDIPDRLNDL
jgi:hypothetical protein